MNPALEHQVSPGDGTIVVQVPIIKTPHHRADFVNERPRLRAEIADQATEGPPTWKTKLDVARREIRVGRRTDHASDEEFLTSLRSRMKP